MRTKLIACAAAAAMLAVPILSDTASARSGWGHGGGWGHRGWGAGAAGFAAGALIGGALASRPYYGGYGYGYGPGYYAYDDGPDYYAAGPAPGGGSVAYCMQRFKSYDPSSGTYLGYDGVRHPCP